MIDPVLALALLGILVGIVCLGLGVYLENAATPKRVTHEDDPA